MLILVKQLIHIERAMRKWLFPNEDLHITLYLSYCPRHLFPTSMGQSKSVNSTSFILSLF